MNAYMEFVATHGKSFASKTHMDDSLDKFNVNYQKMKDHNSQDVPFQLSINQFSDMSESEFI